MQTSCKQCGIAFEITPEDLAFYDKVSPVYNGKKELIPPPSHCPECRMRRRLAWRNDRSLYPTVSALSGKHIISMYNPSRGYVVYDQSEWWSDVWDPLTYGKPYDFDQSFFSQFYSLQQSVPRFNVFNREAENCNYVNYAPHCKDCYLIFGSWFCEDCFYGQTFSECQDSMDCLFLQRSELCYESIDCQDCYHVSFSQNCTDVTNSAFCFDCKNVQHCIGCWNLRQKSYHVFNTPVSKEEFERMQETCTSYRDLFALAQRFGMEKTVHALHQATIGAQNENSSGDFLFGCNNARQCFSVYQSQDVAYCARCMELKDAYDFEGGGKGELIYEGMSNDFGYRSIGGTTCEQLTDAHYCDLCFECKDCFGCVSLRHKQYCIFNKQYTKEEYEALVPKIIEKMRADGEWGEFFPVIMSPFAYNETMAQEYFPLTKDEVLARGWKWRDQTDEMPKVEKVLPASQLPDSIDDIPDDILNWAIECEATKRPFKIIKQELEFYRQMRLPVPRFHPDERHRRRMALRNPRKLWDRACAKCKKQIATSYSPDRPEIVYCEECYLSSVY